MDKRLPLFLFLSFLVLIGWQVLFAPEPPPRDAERRAEGSAVVPSDSPATIPSASISAPTPVRGTVVIDEEERDSGPLFFGDEVGGRGRFLARFSNRGARLVELRLGDFFDVEGLDDEAKRDPEHWVKLVQPVEMPQGSTTGSMLLAASASSRDLAHGVPLEEALWRMEILRDASDGPRGVEFELAPGGGVRFVKRFLFRPESYRFALELELHNEAAGSASTREFVLTPAGCMPPALDDTFYVEPKAVSAGPLGADPDDQTLATKDRDDRGRDRRGVLQAPAPLAFAGVHNKYFAFLLHEVVRSPNEKLSMVGASYESVFDGAWAARHPEEARDAWRFIETHVNLELRVPGEGESATYRYEIYAGPKARDVLLADDPAHELLLDHDLGFFAGIGRLLNWVLGWLDRATGNWGVAIILLTMGIRVLLFPLNRRFQTSMARYQKKMKRVQPKIEELKKRHANDAQKLRQEQARLMQEEGAFPPLGGCLPMFVQIPIFIGLFSALRTNFDLRQAPFLGWITDLSRPDRLLALDLEVPLLFTTLDLSHLNILPILMVVLWILQQKGMPQPADEQAARVQKMMLFMPVFMGVFLYGYAAGLSLYMITQSGLGIFEQHFIKKHWPIDDTELETPKRGCGPFTGFMQNLAEKQKENMKRVEALKRASGSASGPKGRKKRR